MDGKDGKHMMETCSGKFRKGTSRVKGSIFQSRFRPTFQFLGSIGNNVLFEKSNLDRTHCSNKGEALLISLSLRKMKNKKNLPPYSCRSLSISSIFFGQQMMPL